MTSQPNPPLLLFYPTSPVHVTDMRLVIQHMPEWRFVGILYRRWAKRTPGLDVALRQCEIDYLELDEAPALANELPTDTSVLVLGTAVDYFALDLMAWAKQRERPIVAIEEVAQLALNQRDMNNYDAPFDRFFLASAEEKHGYVELGYPVDKLCVSGLLANDRFGQAGGDQEKNIRERIGLGGGENAIVYTTSPLKHRLRIHNKDDWAFRESVLIQIATVSRRTGRITVVKLHPNEDLKTEREKIQEIIPNAIVIGREIGVDELFSITGVLVNRGNSQTCLDAVLRGIPTVIPACGLRTLFHYDGGAYIVEEMCNLAEAIETALANGAPDSSEVRAKHFYRPPNGVGHFIAREISALVGAASPADELFWNWLIKSMLFVGRHDRALQLSERIESRTAWQENVRIALKAHAEERLDDAVAAWRECIVLDQNWYFPHYELAHGYQTSGELFRAIEHAHKAIELHPPFHSLWHEIPMRVVIMASLRKMGNADGATNQLNTLEARGLVDIVPELLIEKAAQLSSVSERLEEAECSLDNALKLLNDFPVNETTDGHLSERAAFQYLDVAKRHAATGDRARSLACLERTAIIASRIRAIIEPIVSQSLELGRQWENDKDLDGAAKCYNLAAETDSVDHRSRYVLARVSLKQGKFYNAFRSLHILAGIPNGPEQVVDWMLSPQAARRLFAYWPATPKSILKPIKLSAWVFAWALQRIVKSGFHDFFEAATVLLMIWMFIARHFYHRLSADFVGIQRAFRALLSRPFRQSSSIYHVTRCPICGGAGKFEYQNKLTPLFRCRKCDHVYARELPDDKALSTLYGDFSYWEKDRCHQGITTIQESKGWETYLNARIGILERLRLLECPSTRTKSVFEIGCAEGMLLHALGKKGIAVSGCEMNRAVAREGMGQLGVQILTDPFENLELPRSHFDLVMSFHTLEHMRFPTEIFAKAATILRPDGAILIEVPCGEEEYENTDHLHFFCETSLRLLLNKFFVTTEILDNSYTNSAGVRIGSIYGFGRGVRGLRSPKDEAHARKDPSGLANELISPSTETSAKTGK